MSISFKKDYVEVIVLSQKILENNFTYRLIEEFITKIINFKEKYLVVTDKNILHGLLLKLLGPFKFHLNKAKNSSHKLLLIEALNEVVKISPLNDVDEFFLLYNLVFFQIFHGRKDLIHEPPEELKISVLKFCSLLIGNLTNKVLRDLYTVVNGDKFSLGISIAVHLVKNERSITLRQEALKFLLKASRFEDYWHGDDFRYGCGICGPVGDLFALYLPGILAPLLEVILRNGTLHGHVTIMALRCWGHVLCVVMADSHCENTLSENEIMKQWLEVPKQKTEELIDINKLSKERVRSRKWFELAAVVIQPLITKILELRMKLDLNCQWEIIVFMAALLTHCTNNLKNSLAQIIEGLVSSTLNPASRFCQVAERALDKFGREKDKIYVCIIEENLYSLINKLPRIVQSRDEKLALTSLDLLGSYLQILGRLNRLQQLISLSSTLKKLVRVIQISFELEMYSEISNQNFSVFDVKPKSDSWSTPWKRFRHFADMSAQNKLEAICCALGEFGPPEAVFDFLLDAYNEEYGARKELLLIMNEIVLHAKEIPDHVVRQLVDFYLDPNNLYPAREVDGVDCPNLKEVRANITKVTLVMEGIGKLAQNLGKRFEDHLLKSLYYVLEGMGNSYEVVGQSATESAVKIAKACGLDDDVGSLIEKNLDYLTYQITIKLKRSEPGVFEVITVLMKNSPLETIPNLEEIINSVLKSSSRNINSPHTISYLRLFQTFVLYVDKWSKTSNKKSPISQSETSRQSEVDQLVDHLKSLCISEEETEKELEEAVEGEEIPEEPETPQLPPHVKMMVEVSNHSLHYLASKDQTKKLIVLEILNEAVWILSEWENELLPLVHKIWSPLVARFDQINDPLIINRSFTLLCSLCHTSKSFIRSRTLKNVLPALQSFLIKEAANSSLKSSDKFFTQTFKLQRELLDNLGKLTLSLGLFEKETDSVIESALPYLSCRQPRQLQEKSIKLLQDLKSHDPYIVWFKVNGLVDDPDYAKNAKFLRDNIQLAEVADVARV